MHCSRSPRRDFFSINIDQQQLGQIVQIIESRTCKHDHTLLFLYNQLYKIVHSCIKQTSSSIWLGFSSQLFHNFMQIKMNCGLGFGEYGSVYWEFWIKYIDSSRWHIWKSNLSFFLVHFNGFLSTWHVSHGVLSYPAPVYQWVVFVPTLWKKLLKE